MFRLTSFVLSHRALVVVVWVLIAVAGGATAPRTVDALSYDFGLPGQPAYETNTEIHDLFDSGGVDDPLVLTAASPDGALATPAGQKRFSEAATAIAGAAPGTRVVTPANSEPSRWSRPTGRERSLCCIRASSQARSLMLRRYRESRPPPRRRDSTDSRGS